MYKFITSILSFTPTNCGSPPPPRRYGTPSPPAPPSLLGTPSPPAPPSLLGTPSPPAPPSLLGTPSPPAPPSLLGTPSPPAPPSLLGTPWTPCVFSVGNIDIITGVFRRDAVICEDGSIIRIPIACHDMWDLTGSLIRLYGFYDQETSSMTKCIETPFGFDYVNPPPPSWPAPTCIRSVLTIDQKLDVATGSFTTACDHQHCLMCEDGSMVGISIECISEYVMEGDLVTLLGTYNGKYMYDCYNL